MNEPEIISSRKQIDPRMVVCDSRIKRLTIKMALVVFAWFMFIPENWETLFFPISLPLALVADNIPSLAKMTAVSPMPGAVRGVLASMAVLVPITGIIALWNDRDCVDIRARKFAEQASAFRILISPLVWILMVGSLCGFLYWFPLVDVKLSYTPTRGQAMLTAMLTNRFILAGGALLFGSVLAALIHVLPIILLSFVALFRNFSNGDRRK